MRLNCRFLMLAPLLMAGLLAGCSSDRENLTPATQAIGVGLGVEVIKTKIERRLQVTCNPLNLISDGTYCVSNYKPTDRQEVWCFRTLGEPDCYGEPDPYSLQGRALPSTPRPLADPRMPMTPPGRHTQADEQMAVAPIGGAAEPAPIPSIVAPVGMPTPQDPVLVAPVGKPVQQETPAANVAPDDINKRLAQ